MGGSRKKLTGLALLLGGTSIIGTALMAGPAAAATNCSSSYCIQSTAGDGQTVAPGTSYAPLQVAITQNGESLSGDVTFAISGVNTANASFAGGGTDAESTSGSGVASTTKALTPTTPGEVQVSATFTDADVDTKPVVMFTLFACGSSTPQEVAGLVQTIPCSSPTTPPDVSRNLPAPGTCDGPAIACDPQTTTAPTVTVAPVVLPETTPTTTGAVLASAGLASTGADTAPLTAAGAGLIALGLLALFGSTVRRRARG